ncbi:MAG: DNA polymerase III subunit gamma/tau [Planctomycetes bacterium]|nr:DNA polymerase III subunit gamma/tau [Planctomycetota bacterium]
MAYTVLARRFRSQTFGDVVGQDAVAQTLKNAIETDRVAHAYLFSGTRGVGKTTMARVLAKSLNCLESDNPTTEPCCKCDSCIAINLGEDLDVIEIDGASNNGVDNIRELRKNAIYRPARARYKIYIIDEIHMLSTGAFNALLKILEEPPEHVKFIFATTEPNKVLPTIQSRCQRFDFRSISSEIIGEQLKKILKIEKIKYEDDVIVHLSRLANGSMRDGLSLLDQLISAGAKKLTVEILQEFLGEADRAKICRLLGEIGDKNAGQTLEVTGELLESGLTPSQILQAGIDCMRDIMVLKTAGDKTDLLVLTKQEREKISEVADKFDIPALIYSITALEKMRWTVKNSENARALLEASLLRLALSEHFLSAEKLLAQIKKKTVAPADSTPAARRGVAASSNKPVPSSPKKPKVQPVFDGPVGIENIKENWQKIIEAGREANNGIAAAICNTMPQDFCEGVLTLAVEAGDEFKMKMCKQRQEQIATFLTAAMASAIRLNFTWSKAAGEKPKEIAKTDSRLSTEERQKVLDRDSIKTLKSGLNATVTSIQPLTLNDEAIK